jgi:opacity protein-like surface antigen
MHRLRSRSLPIAFLLGGLALGALDGPGLIHPGEACAEWYAAGYGGVSLDGRISNGSVPLFGQNMSVQQFPNPTPVTGDFVSQNLTLSDSLQLKNSAMFGGRVGYFFNRYGYSWAGLEIEAFTAKPDLKQQSVPFNQTVLSKNSNVFFPVQPESATNIGSLSFDEASLRVTTIAVNLVARYPGKVFQPYVGVGVGLFYFEASNLRATVGPCTSSSAGSPCPTGFASGSASGTDLQPGLNTFGGLKYFVSEKFALFGEYKYNRATISRLDDVIGLKGDYSIMHLLGGVAYHF